MACYSSRPCMPCRMRKVKCDGQYGMCGPCQRARASLHCTYDPSEYVEIRPRKRILQRGEACIPCRKKKKRCNAARPSCDICSRSREYRCCQYEEDLTVERPRFSTYRKIVPSTYKPGNMTAGSSITPLRIIDLSSMALVRVPSPSPTRPKIAYPSLSPDIVSFHTILDPCSIIGSLIERQMSNNTLINSDQFSSALADVLLFDMDMTFRLIFLLNRLKIGFRFTAAKQQAILDGDLTNTAIHPFFIYFAQLFGCNLYQEQKGEYCYLYTMCIYLRLARGAIETMKEDDDPLSYAEACHLMSLWCTYNNNALVGMEYFTKAVQTIKRYDIRFLQRSLDNIHFSEEVAEMVIFLSQLVYLQLYLCPITSDLDEDPCFDLKQQFLKEVPLDFPDPYEISPLLERARALILASEATILLVSYFAGRISPAWFSSCLAWLRAIVPHIDNLGVQLEHFDDLVDRDNRIFLQYRGCMLFVALAELNKVLKKHQSRPYTPLLHECQNTCSELLNKITTGTGNVVLPDDMKLMALLFQTYSYVVSSNKPFQKLRPHGFVSTSSLRLDPESIFLNTSLLLTGRFKYKLASVRVG